MATCISYIPPSLKNTLRKSMVLMWLACMFQPAQNFNEAKECYLDWCVVTGTKVLVEDIRQLETWISWTKHLPFDCLKILENFPPEAPEPT